MSTSYNIAIHELYCYLPDESSDEVYLMCKGKKVWPKNEKFASLAEGDSTPIKLETSVIKGATVSVELWEYDVLSNDDKLGTFLLEADKLGGPYTSDMIKFDSGKSKYGLNWEVR